MLAMFSPLLPSNWGLVGVRPDKASLFCLQYLVTFWDTTTKIAAAPLYAEGYVLHAEGSRLPA